MTRIARYCYIVLLLTAGYIMATQGSTQSSWFADLATMLQSSKTYIMNLVENTDTPFLRIGIIFILGLLMSLTPCIYPMIPITLGTLQAAAGKSKHNTFTLAFLYTCGIAITFAILGLLAAFGGAQIGTLLGNPWFIVPFVIFLGYLAFSMMGLYELRIPRFLQQQTAISKAGGAYVSAFIFGMLNGTVASPCVSPGLLMLLSIVATLQSVTLGFIYLFAFGFGLGLPLLIIGSFSNAATIMPKAGTWMLEIKRLFGILLLSMAWYYLDNIMSPVMSLVFAAGITASIGLVYAYILVGTTGRWHSLWCMLMIATSVALSGVWITQAATYTEQEPQEDSFIWYNQYEDAREKAINNNAWLLVDFGANWCSLCKQIEKKLLHSPQLQRHDIIIIQINCSYMKDPYVQNMMNKFNINNGLPAILLVEPQEETVATRWQGELVDYSPNEFLQELSYYGVATT